MICLCIAFNFSAFAGLATYFSAASRNTSVGVVCAARAFDFNFRASVSGNRIVNVVVIQLIVLQLHLLATPKRE
jgi:hypothetical protein